MSRSNSRRRASLLSGGSLLAALVMAGAGGVALTPAAAFAANECGDPATNTTAADVFTCTGTFASITYPTTNGNLTLNLLNNVTATTGGLVVTVEPTAATSVTISRLADSPPVSGDPSLTSTSTTTAALQVTRQTSGAITVNLTDADTGDTPLVISGVFGGVLLQNAGAAATGFTSTNGTITASGGAGLNVTSTGTGLVTVTNGSAVSGSTYGIRAGSGTGNVTITNNGQVTGATGAIQVIGGTNLSITNAAAKTMTGLVSLANTGTVNFTNSGTWTFTGTSTLGSGATTLTNNASSYVVTSGASGLDFAAGADTFSNIGILVAGAGAQAASTLTLDGLETWNNSGKLLFGANADLTGSDAATNDRVVAAGALFTGSLDSTLFMDVDLSADQASCAAAVTADCLDLRGSSTAGSTSILVNALGGAFATAERIVLVDVAGAGTSGGGHFTLSDLSTDYRLVGARGTLDRGLYFYTLDYDATAKQHVLEASAFNGKALELARISRAASEPWRTATGMWHDRQLDLRDAVAGKAAGPGVWLKLAGNVINQEGVDTVDLGSDQTTYNISSRQSTTAIVGGVDLMRMYSNDTAWVFGVTAGKLSSTLDYRAGASELELDGYSLGAYASLVSGRLYVDAIVNSASLDLTHSDFGQAFEGAAKSIGYQVEGGYRLFQVNDGGAYIEPIAALSYVATEVDDLDIGPAAARFEDSSSLRAALGVRMAGDMETSFAIARLAFTGRVWTELDGEHVTTLNAPFGASRLIDNDLGSLGDVGVAVGLLRPGGRLSANFGYSLKFGDDYQSSDARIGVSLRW